jgi:hemolysin-activating ACP:hemolysin acyltransferase
LLKRAAIVGHICQFACRFPHLSKAPLISIVKQVIYALEVDQVKVFLNPYGHCVGYVIWGYLTPDVEQQFLDGNFRELAEWEYDDGTSAWILEMAVAPGSLSYVLEDLRDTVFRNEKRVTYFRLKRGKKICKRVSRSAYSSFLRTGINNNQSS